MPKIMNHVYTPLVNNKYNCLWKITTTCLLIHSDFSVISLLKSTYCVLEDIILEKVEKKFKKRWKKKKRNINMILFFFSLLILLLSVAIVEKNNLSTLETVWKSIPSIMKVSHWYTTPICNELNCSHIINLRQLTKLRFCQRTMIKISFLYYFFHWFYSLVLALPQVIKLIAFWHQNNQLLTHTSSHLSAEAYFNQNMNFSANAMGARLLV